MSKQKWEIAYKAMVNGLEVQLPDGHTYTVIDGKLSLRLLRWNEGSSLDGPPDEEIWVESTMPLNVFVKDCEEFSDEKIIEMVFYNAMRKSGEIS